MTSWSREVVDPSARKWEEFYRNRFQHDKRVRTTHGVNCTGSCSWEVFVKDGIVTWELQATDYPQLEEGLPPYEPRGCQRGISYSWYLYSPIRVKYPYARGVLLDLYRQAKAEHDGDPVEAWRSIQADPERRAAYQAARGKGGFRRIGWDEALELAAASTVHTIDEHGPDRVAGFSPIPAMSQVSYAAGSRFLSLIGGVVMSFYDWYCDLPPASPETWGEQTDVHESADWFNARFIAVMGANLNMTRTPDTHFISEVRHAGAKLSVFSPDFSQVAKYADWWIPTNPGQDTAFWLAVNHVLLTEFYRDGQVDYFEGYAKQYTDLPFLIEIVDGKPTKYLRANRLADYADTENGDWKLLMWDGKAGAPRMPNGSIGDRWAKDEPGRWNLELHDSVLDCPIAPTLTFLDDHDDVTDVQMEFFGGDSLVDRRVPTRTIQTADGPATVTTVFDLLMARFGVDRGLGGDAARTYDDDVPYTPAWQEGYTGIHRDTVVSFAREWGRNGQLTSGKNMIIIGAGANHWYHNNLLYRAGITALMLTGSVGVNGGGLAHYVGQEKVVCGASWTAIAMAQDWGMAPRQQNTPSFHYVHSDQWRYERGYREYDALPQDHPPQFDHTIDHQARAVRQGWLPFFPQFNESPIDVVSTARTDVGGGEPAEHAVVDRIVERVTSGDLELSIDDPDAPENWPRTWFIWRGNAIGTSAKGHEYFMRHYLGTDSTAIASEPDDHGVAEVTVRPDAPIGKMDLVVDLNFRMDTSALYSDLVLPAATWYEKDDLNTTDMHTFINPMQAAVPPSWESKSDWDIFCALAAKVSELSDGLLDQVEDVVMQPLGHDSPDEISQTTVADWRAGEVEPIPGKTMPKFAIVNRDYSRLYEMMTTLGPGVRNNGVGVHGLRVPVDDFYDELARRFPSAGGDNGDAPRPDLTDARQVCEAILALDPASNGELAYRAFEAEEKKTGRELTHLGLGQRDTRVNFDAIVAQPRRVMTTPTWSGIISKGRAYSPFTLNVEHLVPWRTLTGRQHFYLDHDNYLAWGEHLPVYKPRPDHSMLSELEESLAEGQNGKLFNYITPHGKWSIHSTYSENERMMTLSRGGYPVWMNAKDAAELGIADNDWVEVYNDNGVFVQRCTTSSRIPRGTVFVYHATERTVGIPISPRRKKRAGMNNSLTRTRLKPVLMSGGYAQFSYGFNYWGPTGVNRDTFVYLRRVDTPGYGEISQ